MTNSLASIGDSSGICFRSSFGADIQYPIKFHVKVETKVNKFMQIVLKRMLIFLHSSEIILLFYVLAAATTNKLQAKTKRFQDQLTILTD